MHDGMTLDTIEGQCQGQGHSKVEKSANFNIISAIYYPISAEFPTDYDSRVQYLNLVGSYFSNLSSFSSRVTS